MRDEQVGARRSFIPLVVMTACFFVPAYNDCGGPKSPLQFVAANASGFWWVAPVFLAAAVFAMLTVRVLALGEVERGVRRAALFTVLALGASTVAGGAFMTAADSAWPLLVAALVGLAGVVLFIRKARGRNPWGMWDQLTAAFAIAAASSGPAIYLAVESATNGGQVKPGGHVFVLACAALLVMALSRAFARDSR